MRYNNRLHLAKNIIIVAINNAVVLFERDLRMYASDQKGFDKLRTWEKHISVFPLTRSDPAKSTK